MPRKPITMQRRIVARSRLFQVEAVSLRFSNGVEAEYERLTPGAGSVGAVLIVPILEGDTVLLVREYAAGTDRYELGLPKGRIEQDEEPLSAAARELREEVGYAAGRLTPLRLLTLAPGYLSHQTQVVLAEQLYPDCLEGDEPEALEVVSWPLSDLAGLLACEELTEARTIAALFMVREHRLRPHSEI
ncbi:MAG: ADP compounds hydrolase NudE [Nitrococcus mobilis]|nr:ADP compounds hydrolase NudE [Nitrococcus mobilis]